MINRKIDDRMPAVIWDPRIIRTQKCGTIHESTGTSVQKEMMLELLDPSKEEKDFKRK